MKLLRDMAHTKWKLPVIPKLKFSKISRKIYSAPREKKTQTTNPQNFAT